MDEVVFKTDVFEGPLDLLVHLVKTKKVDIREVPISVLADEFLEYMRKMEELDIKLSSDFMATASHLMYLKSKALLPKVSERERKEFEEEKERLYELIERYSRVKKIVEEIEKGGKKTRYPVRVNRTFGVMDVAMVEAIKAAVDSVKVKEKVYRIRREEISLEEMMERIINLEMPIDIHSVLEMATSRYELVVMVLAILELIRLEKVMYDGGRIWKP